LTVPDHIAWLHNTGETVATVDGREVEIWVLQHADNPSILSNWATHYRNHYCRDEDLPDLVADTGLSNADFLTCIKFPDTAAAPGPSTRAGDFGEILVADFVEYVLGYWCPRQGRFEDRENRNVPSNGTDVIGFSFMEDEPSPDDELLVIESKAGFRRLTSRSSEPMPQLLCLTMRYSTIWRLTSQTHRNTRTGTISGLLSFEEHR